MLSSQKRNRHDLPHLEIGLDIPEGDPAEKRVDMRFESDDFFFESAAHATIRLRMATACKPGRWLLMFEGGVEQRLTNDRLQVGCFGMRTNVCMPKGIRRVEFLIVQTKRMFSSAMVAGPYINACGECY